MSRNNSIFLFTCIVICIIGGGHSQDKDDPIEGDLGDPTPVPEASENILRCYQCNSSITGCGDGDEFNANTVKSYLKACPEKDHEGKETKYKLCRKIYQKLRGEIRIFRLCGYEKYHLDCYNTISEEYSVQTCQCFSNGCNGGTSFAIFSTLVFLPFVIGLLH